MFAGGWDLEATEAVASGGDVRWALGDADFDEAYRAGRALTMDEAPSPRRGRLGRTAPEPSTVRLPDARFPPGRAMVVVIEHTYDRFMTSGLSTAIDELLTLDPDGLDDASLHDLVVGLQRVSDRLAAVRARFVSAWDGRGIWAQDGSKAPGARLARDARCAPATACREVKRARKLRTMPATTAAFAEGSLSMDHVDQLAAANCDKVAALFARDEQVLVREGQRLGFDNFHRLMAHWRNIADDAAAEDRADRHHHDRYLRAATTLDGVIDLQGRFDPVAGAIVTTELGRLERQLFEDDWAKARAEHGDQARPEHLGRTGAQRLADAMELMARRSAAMPEGARPARPLITVLVGLETFKGRICELANGTVITPGQVVGLLTEADFERVVFDSPSRVVDIGAKRRFFTGATRRAIEVRDRTCYFPGCGEPADRCDVDHIIERCDDGPTIQDNGRLACGTHNRQRPGRASPPDNGP
ncbi:MAG: hypothetical protein JWM47_338 [Acidimicrobiales bacterium]|nr:hypothetical protein [Acidimicrobiales bacterium]